MDGKLPLKANLELEGWFRFASQLLLTVRFRPIPTLWSPKITL